MTVSERPRLTALIVEDDRSQSELGALVLDAFDLEVEQVDSAEAALESLARRSGDVGVVLADIHLSGEMNGLQLARRISILWPTISIIVTSGDPDGPGEHLPDRATFIPKPWRPLDIVAAAERAWRADHSVRALRL